MPDDEKDRVEKAYGANYDPSNLFSMNQNIRPA
jgi:hypothetical protein